MDYTDYCPITVERVEELHREAIKKHGGDYSQPNTDCIKQCLGSAVTSALYQQQEGAPNPLVIAGFLLFYFVENHCFSDGNKRVGWLVFTEMLRRNHVDIDAEKEEVYSFVDEIAMGNNKVDDILFWAEERITAPKEDS